MMTTLFGRPIPSHAVEQSMDATSTSSNNNDSRGGGTKEDPFDAFGKSLSLPTSTASSDTASTTPEFSFVGGSNSSDGSSSSSSSSGEGTSLEDAVRDAQRRRRVDPRTHG